MIALSKFVRRQQRLSPYSYYDGSEESLLALINKALKEGRSRQGYKPGVLLVSVDPEGFYSGVIDLEAQQKWLAIMGSYEERRAGEQRVVSLKGGGDKAPAKIVDVVLYQRGLDPETDAEDPAPDWWVISINASCTENEPMQPTTMARNEMARIDPSHPWAVGGTPTEYSAEEYRRAVMYWAQHVMHA